MRGSRATLQNGLNDYNCKSQHDTKIQFCSREISPTSLTTQFYSAGERNQLSSFPTESSSSYVFIALVGWILFLCAGIYIVFTRRRVSAAGWLLSRSSHVGALLPHTVPFSFKQLNEMECEEEQLHATANDSRSAAASNVRSVIPSSGRWLQVDHYTSLPLPHPALAPLTLSQTESSGGQLDNAPFFENQIATTTFSADDGSSAHRQLGLYRHLIEEK